MTYYKADLKVIINHSYKKNAEPYKFEPVTFRMEIVKHKNIFYVPKSYWRDRNAKY